MYVRTAFFARHYHDDEQLLSGKRNFYLAVINILFVPNCISCTVLGISANESNRNDSNTHNFILMYTSADIFCFEKRIPADGFCLDIVASFYYSFSDNILSKYK